MIFTESEVEDMLKCPDCTGHAVPCSFHGKQVWGCSRYPVEPVTATTEKLDAKPCHWCGKIVQGICGDGCVRVRPAKPAESITEADLSMDWPEPLPPKEAP